MIKWKLLDQRLIVSELSPDSPAIVLIDKSLGKWLLGIMNDAKEADKKLAEAKEEIKLLKSRIIALNQKCSRRDATIQNLSETSTEDIEQEPTTPKKRNRVIHFKERQCPGYGSRAPHMFTPASGRQTMCPSCKAAMKAAKGKPPSVHITWHGSAPLSTMEVTPQPKESSNSLVEGATVADKHPQPPEPTIKMPSRPSVEDILRMPDGPEKKALMDSMSLAEKLEAAKIRFKLEREKMRAMRNKGFDLNDPIVGVGS